MSVLEFFICQVVLKSEDSHTYRHTNKVSQRSYQFDCILLKLVTSELNHSLTDYKNIFFHLTEYKTYSFWSLKNLKDLIKVSRNAGERRFFTVSLIYLLMSLHT